VLRETLVVRDRRRAFGCALLLERARAGGTLPAAAAAGAQDGRPSRLLTEARMLLLRKTRGRLVDPGQHIEVPHPGYWQW